MRVMKLQVPKVIIISGAGGFESIVFTLEPGTLESLTPHI